MGIPHEVGGVQSHLGGDVHDALVHLGFGHLGEVGQQRLLDDVVNRHAGVQGGVGILEDHLDLLAVLLHGLGIDLGEVHRLPVPGGIENLALGGLVGPDDAPPQSGLATPGLAHDADGLPLVHREAHVGHGPDADALGVETHMDVLHIQNLLLTAHASLPPSLPHPPQAPSLGQPVQAKHATW